MIGRDAAEASDAEWRRFADEWRREQLRAIEASLARVSAAHPGLAAAPIVGAGCGRFLAAALARQEARSYVDFAMLAGAGAGAGAGADDARADAEVAEWIATCAPSVAVALLAASATSIELLPRAGGEGQTLAA
jgi:(4-(4-[2-(gamma-L-glutamylamino)ethyl]phenoxymethyl)furan-2-yl)methanamine synthase